MLQNEQQPLANLVNHRRNPVSGTPFMKRSLTESAFVGKPKRSAAFLEEQI